MIFDVYKGDQGRLIDLDTGKEIVQVFWCDDTDSPRGHEYKKYKTKPDGSLFLDAAFNTVEEHVKGVRIRFVPHEKSKVEEDMGRLKEQALDWYAKNHGRNDGNDARQAWHP
jgi:hypothetical protein